VVERVGGGGERFRGGGGEKVEGDENQRRWRKSQRW